MSEKNYISLSTKTTFSIGLSLIKPSELFKKVKELGQSGVGITDNCMGSAWDSLKYSKEAGVKLIMGYTANFVDDVQNCDNVRLRNVVLLAKNHTGYKNLLKLNRIGYDYGVTAFKRFIPRIDWKLLEEHSEGLICLTGDAGGILGNLINTRRLPEARKQAAKLKELFGDSLGFEIQPHNMSRKATPFHDDEDQNLVNRALITLGEQMGIRVVATNHACYATKEEWDSWDTYMCITTGKLKKEVARLRYPNEFYLKTRDEIVGFFNRSFGARAEEFCDNSLYFAGLCENPEWIDPRPEGKGWELPEFPVKNQPDYEEFRKEYEVNPELNSRSEDAAYVRYLCEKELTKQFGDKYDEYKKRLEMELEVFEMKNLAGYLLIIKDFLEWARNNGIPVNEGRGSIGGSLSAYLLKIHNADPIKYGLIFERFYNKEKTSCSDCDSDISKAGKPLVEEYIYNKYGQRYCAQISNFATLTPKPYARAIARTYMYGGDRKASVAVGNSIADVIPKDIHYVEKALEQAPLFAEWAKSDKYKELASHAKHIGNQVYNLSTHAAGVVIGSRPLDEIVPVRKSKEGVVALEYEKERAEENGLVKMDILGLSTLDIVQDTLKIIQSRNKTLPQIPWNYDANDEKTYELIGKGNNFGVFQLGTSAGTIDLCRQLKPKNIIDLAVINALARPGFPKEVRGEFIEVKLGKKKAKVFHSILENSFRETYGFLLFEETLLRIANDVAGWSMNQADRLRKMVKEKGRYPSKEAKLKQDFILGAVQNRNLDEKIATKIWDEVVASSASYLFNKSHAVLYSMLSYQTAYLKAHYPLEFLIANLNYEVQSNAQDSEKNILQIKNEIRGLGVKIISPNLNRSGMSYQIVDDNAVMCGLDALKYMGKDAIPEILAKRPFTSFEDFLSRTNGRLVRAPAIQALAAAGCLDEFGLTRKQMYLYSGDYKKKLAVWQKRKGKNEPFHYPWPDVGEFTVPELHALEIYYLGEGLTGTAKEVYPNFFSRKVANIAELMKKYPASKDKETIELQPNDGSIEGIVTDYFEFKVKKEDSKYFGQEMARITMQDLDGNTFNCVVFPDRLGEVKKRMKALCGSKLKKIEPGCAIGVFGNLNWYQGELSIICDGLKKICPPPQLPEDRKPKQIKMKITGAPKKKKKGEQLEMFSEPEDILNEIEDELVEEGLNNPEETEDDAWIDFEEDNYREENGEIFEDDNYDSEDAFN